MDLGQIDIFHIIRTVVVANLTSCPIDTLNFDNLAILDLAAKWNYSGSMGMAYAMTRLTYCLDAIGSVFAINLLLCR